MRTRGTRALVLLTCVVAAMAGLTACTTTRGVQAPASTPAATTPTAQVVPTATAAPSTTAAPNYQSSWTMSLSATSCALWIGEMFPAQRQAAAGQMLSAARTGHGFAGPPADELVTGFEADVTATCAENGEQTVQEAGDAVYAGPGHAKYSS